MTLKPTISLQEYQAVHRAINAAKPKVARPRSWRYYVALAVTSLSLGILVQWQPAQEPVLAICIAFLAFSLVCKPLVRRQRDAQIARFFLEEQSALNNQTITIDEAAITSHRQDESAMSRYDWKAFEYQLDTPDAFLFLPSPNTFIRIPKGLLTPNEESAISGWSRAVPVRNNNSLGRRTRQDG